MRFESLFIIGTLGGFVPHVPYYTTLTITVYVTLKSVDTLYYFHPNSMLLVVGTLVACTSTCYCITPLYNTTNKHDPWPWHGSTDRRELRSSTVTLARYFMNCDPRWPWPVRSVFRDSGARGPNWIDQDLRWDQPVIVCNRLPTHRIRASPYNMPAHL